MQFKGLVRFFTILLIVYSVYQLSFTWFVKRHESKMEKVAISSVNAAFPEAAKYTRVDDYPDSIKAYYDARLRRVLDSTSDKTLTYGITGAVSYRKAKEEELNLGLDLQGGMNVTLEVEMTGLLRTLSNNSKDPSFLTALSNAEKQKGNSERNFIDLFVAEYKKLVGEGKLAGLFYSANQDRLKIGDSDAAVTSFLRSEANTAFSNTEKALSRRIDQFGVAQPTINPEANKGIITVELPGIKDKERVRKQLQASANLQFWETYPLTEEMGARLQAADNDFDAFLKGTAATTTEDTASKEVVKTEAPTVADTTKNTLTDLLGNDSADKKDELNPTAGKRSLSEFIQFIGGQGIGVVQTKDTALVRDYLNAPAIRRHFPADARFAYGVPSKSNRKLVPLYVLRTYNQDKAPIEGDVITSAQQSFDQVGNPVVSMSMNQTGSIAWANLTDKSYRNTTPIAIVMDNIVYSAPVAYKGKIEGGRTEISGDFTLEEAKDLSNLLQIGKLSAPAKIVQEQEVGPTLGAAAIRGGSLSFFISFIVIFVLMLIYYNTGGWVANIALFLNLLFTVGILTGLGSTLTAPGIAGLVLTIGMAVDTNVLVFERIKEELFKGKSYQQAVVDGYKRTLPPVLDGHITSLITAIILFYFGLGPIKGFATTQIIGLALSVFCGILVSRWVTDIFTDNKRHLQYFTSVSRKIFNNAKFHFVKYRRITYIIGAVIFAMGIASFFNGFDYGVEFNGGRSYTIKFAEKVPVENLRNELKETFGSEPIIKTIGDTKTLDITTAYMINETDQTAGGNVDSIVLAKLQEGLKNYIPAGLTYQQFDTDYKVASKKVLPTISDDLKRGAIKATIIALVLIFIYIFIRFRDWRYSVATIIATAHDAIVTLIVFSFARNIVPFPLEIDQHFIAAFLTVIGFSMNDTVVIFDRIRENRQLHPSLPFADTIDKSINETLSRTIMTSVTVFLTVLILFIFGGEVTRGFSFAMLIGVIVGCYSSIYVAAPILLDMGAEKAEKKKKAAATTAKA